jgi:hypothetical protein
MSKSERLGYLPTAQHHNNHTATAAIGEGEHHDLLILADEKLLKRILGRVHGREEALASRIQEGDGYGPGAAFKLQEGVMSRIGVWKGTEDGQAWLFSFSCGLMVNAC